MVFHSSFSLPKKKHLPVLTVIMSITWLRILYPNRGTGWAHALKKFSQLADLLGDVKTLVQNYISREISISKADICLFKTSAQNTSRCKQSHLCLQQFHAGHHASWSCSWAAKKNFIYLLLLCSGTLSVTRRRSCFTSHPSNKPPPLCMRC